MNLFKEEYKKERKEFQSIEFRNQRRSLKVGKHQTGKTNKARDVVRKALAPGWRISKTGKKYYEGRKNRSDKVGTKL